MNKWANYIEVEYKYKQSYFSITKLHDTRAKDTIRTKKLQLNGN
jgi:hypothetical protein